MRIAILGATSDIARDLVCQLADETGFEFGLYARRPDVVRDWLVGVPTVRCTVGLFDDFSRGIDQYDAVLNFVGAGNPAQVANMGRSIINVTQDFDDLVLGYLEKNPACRYIFFSSGAAYGGDFAQPVGDDTQAKVPLNQMQASDWYGLAKLYAECRHRALPNLSIVDVRVFNYFSHTQSICQRFLITDILRAIAADQLFQTSAENIVRDYLGPQDMFQLIKRILDTPACNTAVDCYTRAPVDKLTMLEAMRIRFGLRYEFDGQATGFAATGGKKNYYSTSQKAASFFNYAPAYSALETVLEQAERKIEQERPYD